MNDSFCRFLKMLASYEASILFSVKIYPKESVLYNRFFNLDQNLFSLIVG